MSPSCREKPFQEFPVSVACAGLFLVEAPCGLARAVGDAAGGNGVPARSRLYLRWSAIAAGSRYRPSLM